MNCIIPFTKDIKFKTNIAEILSISLEHDYTANPEEILGNFTISGDYKSHEISVNKEPFEYVLPFSVSMTNKIDTNSVDFAIEDFTYEVIDNDTLRVNIEYSINAPEIKEEEKDLFIEVEEPTLDNILDEIEETNETREEIEDATQSNERDIAEDTKATILNNVSNEDSFVIYKVHEMKETDTIESICLKYNVSENILNEYNDMSNVSIKDKIIIPEINE